MRFAYRHVRRDLIRAAKLVVVVLLIWAIRRTLVEAFDALDSQLWTLKPAWLVLAALLYLAGLAPSVYFWRRVLTTLGDTSTLWDVARAYYVGHLGKYLPGKAMVVVLRVGLLSQGGASVPVRVASVFYETFSMLAVGMAVSAVILPWIMPGETMLWLIIIAAGIASWLPTWPPIFGWLIHRTRPSAEAAAIDLVGLHWTSLIPAWLLLAAGWVLQGAALWAVLRAMGKDLPIITALPNCTAAAALSLVAGFYSMIPAGAIVREAVLGKLLAPQVGEVTALSAAIVLRLTSVVAELLISTILYLSGSSVSANRSDRQAATDRNQV